jgi:MFS family permease
VNTTSRGTATIFTGVVLATTGVYATVTMGPVLADELTGSAFLAGLPTACLLAGAAGGSAVMASVIRLRGRRAAMTANYTCGALACAVALVAVSASLFPLLLVAMLGIGAGHAANQLARYAAADLHAAPRRPTVLGWMVWAQAVGAAAGPLLLGPSGRLAQTVAGPPESGPFLAGMLLFVLAAALHLRRGRDEVSPVAEPEASPATGLGTERGLWALPSVRLAVVALVTSQVIMLLVMTMTPVHARHGGHAIGAIGAIMSSHMLGMFALAPVTGRLTARFGSTRMIGAGLVLLAASGLWAAAVPVQAHARLAGALFLLGLGWNFGFVASSALLASLPRSPERAALQARVEAVTWSSGAAASVASGLLLGLIGFAVLCLLAASLVAIPLVALGRHRRALAATAPTL